MNDTFRREFQRVLPLCGSIGQTSQPPDEPAAAADTRSAKAADGGKTRLTTFADSGDAGKITAAGGGDCNVLVEAQYSNDAVL